MKKIAYAFMVLLGLAVSAAAGPTEVLEILPSSNEPNPLVQISSAVNPSAIVVSSATNVATRLDTTLNASLNTAMGANYRRAEVTVQNTGSVAIYVGYSPTGWTTATGGYKLGVGDVWTFKLGRGVFLYAISTAGSAGEARVGGLGYRN